MQNDFHVTLNAQKVVQNFDHLEASAFRQDFHALVKIHSGIMVLSSPIAIFNYSVDSGPFDFVFCFE